MWCQEKESKYKSGKCGKTGICIDAMNQRMMLIMRAKPQLFWRRKCTGALHYIQAYSRSGGSKGQRKQKTQTRDELYVGVPLLTFFWSISRAIFNDLPGRSSYHILSFYRVTNYLSLLLTISIAHLFNWPKKKSEIATMYNAIPDSFSVRKQTLKSPSLLLLFMYIAVSLLCTKFPSLHQTRKKGSKH